MRGGSWTLWSWNIFSFWTFSGNRKFACFLIFGNAKNHRYCLAKMTFIKSHLGVYGYQRTLHHHQNFSWGQPGRQEQGHGGSCSPSPLSGAAHEINCSNCGVHGWNNFENMSFYWLSYKENSDLIYFWLARVLVCVCVLFLLLFVNSCYHVTSNYHPSFSSRLSVRRHRHSNEFQLRIPWSILSALSVVVSTSTVNVATAQFAYRPFASATPSLTRCNRSYLRLENCWIYV